MKYLLTVMLFSALFACNNDPNVEAMTKAYMKDSIVSTFNDPHSYEFVSMKVDTLMAGEYASRLQEGLNSEDTSSLGKEFFERDNRKIAALKSNPNYKDSILHLNINVKYRGKNKMGALILDNVNLVYLPKENRITTLENLASFN
jgi:hypothetical protein